MRQSKPDWMRVLLVAALATAGSSQRSAADDDVKSDQESRPNVEPARSASESPTPRERVSQSFERNSPRIGEVIPDVSGYDSAGKEFRLRNLRGHHTVLVFGCLT